MFRNQYDGDNTTWSPQGRIHQVEYAAEAVKQGSATVGLKSKTHALLVALHRSPSELASYQKKIVKIDNHVGVAFSGTFATAVCLINFFQGLTSDARVLSNFMRAETMRSRMVYNRPLPITRIVSAVGEKAQINTQRYGRRPYGVGLLVAGYDESGARLFECSPTGNYFDYVAVSIGARSQSAKTYLEKHYEKFANSSLDELVVHGLFAIRDTIQQDKTITTENVSIAFVGADAKFTVITGSALQSYIDLMGEGNAPPNPAAPVEQDVAMSS